MKSLKQLKGAKLLSREEQRGVKGGLITCYSDADCPDGYDCGATTGPLTVPNVCFLSPPGWYTGD